MAIVKGTNGLSLNIQDDYLTLRTPNGNYTASFSGAKASGKLASDKNAFQSIDKYVENAVKNSNYGDVMKTLLDPKLLTSLWPAWNEKIEPNLILVGDTVKFINSTFAKKYPNGYLVKKVARKNVFIQLSEKDIDRQNVIENFLKCKFIRIKDL